jgi:hypothetical protein
MKTILIHGQNNQIIADAIVADEDYLYLHQYKWKMYNCWAYRDDESGNPVFMQHEVAKRAKMSENIEHISGDKLDNRRANLRDISPPILTAVATPLESVCPLPYGKWEARIEVNGQPVIMGLFSTEPEARAALDNLFATN